jgi:DNA-binding response OmpR family regulator
MLKVLIAEDDFLLGDLLEDVLVDGGYQVCGIARSVAEAIELGKRHRPDLAVLDVRLAEGSLGTDIVKCRAAPNSANLVQGVFLQHLIRDGHDWLSAPA